MRLRAPALAALVGACAALAGCKPTVGPAAAKPTLAAEIQSDMAAVKAIAWSGERPLRWSDFTAAAPRSGDEGALTAYSIFYGVRCTGHTFEFLTVAGFLPADSWVKPGVLANHAESERTLRHEQTHFDLTEVHTRRLRKTFSDLYEPCSRSDLDLDALARQSLASEKAEQERYDLETRHGLATSQQTTWDHRVAEDLAALARYTR